MLFGSGGKVIRFKESDVRAMGRTARGVRGIKLKTGQKVISLIIPETDGQLLIASRNGYGKRSQVKDFSIIGRGGQGVIGMKLSERNGDMVGATQVFPGDEVLLISDQGTLVRTRIDEVSLQGRNTQGVRLINLAGEEHLVGLARVQEPENGDDAADEDIGEGVLSTEGSGGSDSAEGSLPAEGSDSAEGSLPAEGSDSAKGSDNE